MNQYLSLSYWKENENIRSVVMLFLYDLDKNYVLSKNALLYKISELYIEWNLCHAYLIDSHILCVVITGFREM